MPSSERVLPYHGNEAPAEIVPKLSTVWLFQTRIKNDEDDFAKGIAFMDLIKSCDPNIKPSRVSIGNLEIMYQFTGAKQTIAFAIVDKASTISSIDDLMFAPGLHLYTSTAYTELNLHVVKVPVPEGISAQFQPLSNSAKDGMLAIVVSKGVRVVVNFEPKFDGPVRFKGEIA